ncbi:MAG: hypothetical protein ACJASX_000496 [Limisphaerales bacterium]|jgi:hypothetical protein
MFPLADTKDATAVQSVVQSIHVELFPRADQEFIPRVFGWALAAFEGRYRDYQPIDAKYHDLEHTLQGTLCHAQILRGRIKSGLKPVIPQKMFELGIIAILLHDTGYLKVWGDNEGTGAKYTLIHVSRSADFAKYMLLEEGFSPEDASSVARMIRCTGVNVKVDAIPFQTDTEKIIGYSLGSADLVGQMAAPDYIDKLPILFDEFIESARYSGGLQSKAGLFKNAEELLRKTVGFWTFYVKPKIDGDFLAQYKFLAQPYPDGANAYIKHIEKNLARVQRIITQLDQGDTARTPSSAAAAK